MKKKLLIAFVVALFSFLPLPIQSVDAESVKVAAIEPGNVLNWIDESSSYYDENGLHGIRKYNDSDPYSNGIGIKQQFNVENGRKAEIEFQIPDYDEATRTLKENHVAASVPYDIYLVNVDTGFHSIFRLWSSNSEKVNEHSSWVQFCETETSSWETYAGGYISGVLTDSSSFKISFDTENYMSFYCSWTDKEDPMIPFTSLGEIGDKKEQYLQFMDAHYKDASYIEIWFAHQSLEKDTINEVVISSINQQSFAVDENNQLLDEMAPVIPNIIINNESAVYTKNTEYTLRVEKWLHNPTTKADFAIRPIMDFASVVDDLVSSVKVKIKGETDSSYQEVGKIDVASSMVKGISFPDIGTYLMIVEVRDLANHIATSDALSVSVVKGYDISLQGTVNEQGKVNEPFLLPSAVATDENNTVREVTIKVEDPIGNEVPLEDRTFIPLSVGIYYVTYSSSYIDDQQQKHAAKDIVREIIILNNDTGSVTPNKGCKGNIYGSFSTLIILAGLIVYLKNKKG